jgi:hypothetical protein
MGLKDACAIAFNYYQQEMPPQLATLVGSYAITPDKDEC